MLYHIWKLGCKLIILKKGVDLKSIESSWSFVEFEDVKDVILMTMSQLVDYDITVLGNPDIQNYFGRII